MQDRFKFKFWDTKEKVMFNWDCVCQTAFNQLHKEGNKLQRYGLMYNLFTNSLRYTPLQCTGLKDINGKLIFEGDILKVNAFPTERSGTGVVEYEQPGGSFVTSGFLREPSFYHPRHKGEFYLPLQEWLIKEVIGNIYENPDLLERSK